MAYTLTFDNSAYCKVNSLNVNSPYTLSNGDVITVTPNYGNFVVNNTTYSTSTANTIDISNSDITITKGGSVPALDPVNTIINFSEATANRISVDMSTLSGWANIASGSHTLTIKAKADGYTTSDASTGVTFTKAVAGYTVTVSWADNYSMWKKIQYSTDNGATWIDMPNYAEYESGNATITTTDSTIKFKVFGTGYYSVYKDGKLGDSYVEVFENGGTSGNYQVTNGSSFKLDGND